MVDHTQENAPGNAAKREILLKYLEHLRAEVILKLEFSQKLGYYKLLALGVMLGLVASKEMTPEYRSLIILAIAILPLVFDWAMYTNGKAILTAGNYINDYLEPELEKLQGAEPVMLWERYIREKIIKCNKGTRPWNLHEAAEEVLTLATQAGCLYITWPKKETYVIMLTMMLTVFLLVAVMKRK